MRNKVLLEQLQLQSKIVELLKEAGAKTVGIRFTNLPEEELEKHRILPVRQKIVEIYYLQIVKRSLLLLRAEKAESVNRLFPVNLAVSLARLGKKSV